MRQAVQNGLGFAVAEMLREVEKIETLLAILPETAAIYGNWKSLVVKHNVLSSMVHDTKLVAAMTVHGIGEILTFNSGDFARYGLEAIRPASSLV
jgi:predicted nucleic acid-binding protein